jgi:DNA-binding SARP family transcriptional activator/DNA-binding beta-propeller fold protein YncE
MEFRILGPLEVCEDGRPLPLGGGRQRALLALLLLHRNEVVATERLIDELWGERPPETVAKVLQGYVSQLRRVLEHDGGEPRRLLTRPPGYLLRLEPGELDAERFEQLVAQARRAFAGGEPAEAAECLRAALALFRGSPLAEFAFEPFARAEIVRLEELHLVALEERIDTDLALGRHADLVGELEGLVAAEPLRERLRGQLMLSLYRCGRQAEALEAYRDARRALVDELGLEPSEALQELERQILSHDPALEGPVRVERKPLPTEAPSAAPPTGPAPVARRALRRPGILIAAGTLVLVATLAGLSFELRDSGAPAVAIAPNSVAVIDAKTNELVGDVAVGSRPAAVAIGFGAVWVANADDGTVSRIDPSARRVVKTIGVGAPASDLAVGDEGLWVATGSGGTLARIDPRFDEVVETVDLRGSSKLVPNSVHAVAVGTGDPWLARSDKMVLRIDRTNGVINARVPVPLAPVAIAVGEGAVWVALIEGLVLRIEPRTRKIAAVIRAAKFPVAIAAGNGAVWVSDTDGTLWRIDPDTNSVAGTIPVGANPTGLALGRDAIWTADTDDGTATRIDVENPPEVTTIELGSAPTDVAVGEDAIWVSVRAAAT